MMTSSFPCAWARLPDTGESRYRTPRAAAALATSRAMPAVLVLESMTMVPAAAAPITPEAPSMTSRVATSSATIDTTNSAPRAASAGLSAT